jgi:hypothetical protein
LALANLTMEALPMAGPELDSLDLGEREMLLSTEDARYGGSRKTTDSQILPHEMLVFGESRSRP